MADSDRRELTDDMGVALRASNQGLQATIWTALPAFVVEYDPTKMTCKVQPTIQAQVLNAQGVTKWVTLPLLVDCPVVFPSGGGFTLTFPIEAGDEVLVVFSSRCIDSWWHSGGIQVQAELRMHDLSDGFIIPGPHSRPKVPQDVSAVNVELRDEFGLNKVVITPNGSVEITAATKVQVTAPLTRIIGDVLVTGNMKVTGDISTNILPSYNSHKHVGVRSGGEISGTPLPGS